jgi:hypothetical protein
MSNAVKANISIKAAYPQGIVTFDDVGVSISVSFDRSQRREAAEKFEELAEAVRSEIARGES